MLVNCTAMLLRLTVVCYSPLKSIACKSVLQHGVYRVPYSVFIVWPYFFHPNPVCLTLIAIYPMQENTINLLPIALHILLWDSTYVFLWNWASIFTIVFETGKGS